MRARSIKRATSRALLSCAIASCLVPASAWSRTSARIPKAEQSLRNTLAGALALAGGNDSALVIDTTTGQTLFSSAPNAPRLPVMDGAQAPGWQKKFIDPHALATEAMRKGQPQKAFEILYKEVERQRSGRGRFQRKLQLAQLCIGAGKDAIAQPLLDDIQAAVETYKLEEWEDREMVAGVLAFLLQASKKIQGDAKAKQAIFERICRLDPVQAFSV